MMTTRLSFGQSYRRVMGAVVCALALVGCSSEDDSMLAGGSDERDINLTSTLENAQTRTVTELQTNQLSTSVMVGGFGVSGGATVKYGNNNQYHVQNSGALKAKSKEMIWPQEDGAKVDIYAYAPYQKGWTYDGDNSFSVSTDQTTDEGYLASDLLYAAAKGKTQQSAAVSLDFTHQLARINVTIKKTASSNVDLSKATAYLTGSRINTTFCPQKGEIGTVSGTAPDIKIATGIGATSEKSVTAYGIIIPQKIAAGMKFVKIVADTLELYARLGSDMAFEKGKSYNFTATVDVTKEMDLQLGSVTLTGWSDPTALSSHTDEVESYGVGDYVLKDGSLLKAGAADFDARKSQIIAVIFSREVSSTDLAAGYAGYAMGLVRHKNRSWYAGGSYGFGVSGLEAALADLDGRLHTEDFHAGSLYKHITDSLTAAAVTANIHITNFSDYSLKPDAGVVNLSDWFCPSFGQLVQIMNNLGGAKITKESINSKNDKGVVAFSNWGAFYRYSTDESADRVENSTIVSNINAKVTPTGKSDILAVGNISIPTLTENANRSSETYFEFVFSTTTGWEMTAAQGKWSNNNNKAVDGRSVLPVLAFKLPN